MLVDEVLPSTVADNYSEVVKPRNYSFYLVTVE